LTKIYHYTKLAIALEYILPKMELRTNSLERMNDPKENQPWAFGGKNIDYKEGYPETYSFETHNDHQYKLGREIKNSSQIICFVKDQPEQGFLNEIMWAHYSENHKGVCLEIDVDLFLNENREQLNDFVFESVSYGQQENPYLDWNEELTKEQNIKQFVRSTHKKLFLQKSVYWEKENEQRLIVFSYESKHLTIKKSLTGIYFGLQMPYSYKPCIDNFINSDQTMLYNLYYEGNKIKVAATKFGENRPLITRKFADEIDNNLQI
jgi:hypothetical protein